MASTHNPQPSSDLPPREQLELFSETGQGAGAAHPAPAIERHMAKKSESSPSVGADRQGSGGGGGTCRRLPAVVAARPRRSSTPRSRPRRAAAISTTRSASSRRARCPTCATASSRCSAASSTRCCTTTTCAPMPSIARARRSSATCSVSTTRTATRSVYDAMVRMAQDFALRVPLVDGSGNFGSLDGDAAAAYRYTECRLAPPAMELLRELDFETVDMRANYDGTTEEPTVLPARFPNLLVNGSTGIAVGMATNIPPHNLREIANALIALADDRDIEHVTLMKHINGPDFPTGGQLLNSKVELRQIYEDGQGTIRVRGEYKLEEKKQRRHRHRHHLDPVRDDQGVARREDRRGDHRAQAAVPARRARRVDDRRPHRARDQEGRRPRAGDGVPLQAHAAAVELPRQPDLPGAARVLDGGGAGRLAAAAAPAGDQGDARSTSSTSASIVTERRFEYELEKLERADPHPRGLRHDLRRARRDHQDHPRERRQGRRRRASS